MFECFPCKPAEPVPLDVQVSGKLPQAEPWFSREGSLGPSTKGDGFETRRGLTAGIAPTKASALSPVTSRA
jgi:hypothetical protein